MRIICEKGDNFWLGIFAVYDGDRRRYLVYADPPPQPLYDRLYLAVAGRRRDDELFRQSLIKWAVAKIEVSILNGAEPGVEPGAGNDKMFRKLIFDETALQEIAEIASDKSCAHKEVRSGAYFCTAAVADRDPTAHGSTAPTSRPLCMRCDLPAREYICSNLHHSAIGARIADSHVLATERYLVDAHCNLGKDKNGNGSRCHAWGNECWERTVEPRLIKNPDSYAPQTLSQSLDYLNSVWRLKFGNSQRLLQLRSAASIAGLEAGCTSRDEFESRLSSLSDTIKSFDIPDALIKDASIPSDQTIKRLSAAVSQFGGGTAPSGEFTAAISTLAAVNELRVSFQHGATKANQANAFKTLGVASPGAHWSSDWDTIRGLTAAALGVIAQELNKHT